MRPTSALGLCCLICAALAAEGRLPALTSQEAPTGGSLGGIVVDAESKPLPDARVQVRLIDSAVDVASVVTSGSGTFSFDRLRPGTYVLSASRPGSVAMEYGATRPRGAGTPLVLKAGDSLDHLTIPLRPGGVITGTVKRPDGSGSSGGSVVLYEERIGSSGHRTWAPAGSAQIDDRSVYRIFGLAPGTYAIRATPRERASTATGHAFTPTFYPTAMTLADAGHVTISASEEQSGVDIVMAFASTVRVEGRVIAPASSRPLQPGDVELDALDPLGTMSSGGIAQVLAGRFTLSGVFPGEYRLQAKLTASHPTDSLSASRVISVGTADFLNADLMLQPSGVLTGRVALEAGSGPIDVSAVRVRLRSMDSTIPPSAEPADGRVSARRNVDRPRGLPRTAGTTSTHSWPARYPTRRSGSSPSSSTVPKCPMRRSISAMARLFPVF